MSVLTGAWRTTALTRGSTTIAISLMPPPLLWPTNATRLRSAWGMALTELTRSSAVTTCPTIWGRSAGAGPGPAEPGPLGGDEEEPWGGRGAPERAERRPRPVGS